MNVTSFGPTMLSILRIVTGLLFLEHGSSKLLNFPPPPPGMAHALTPLLEVAGVLELCGGILILVGLFTRPVAFLLSGEMAVAYFMVHFPNGLFPMLNKGEIAVLYCFIFLYLFFVGGGPLSLDAALRRRS